jgi:hypothetical protein
MVGLREVDQRVGGHAGLELMLRIVDVNLDPIH